MNDNIDDKLDKLFAAARSVRPDTGALEDFFETRLVARLREKRENTRLWYSWAWRLVPVFMVTVIILGSVSLIGGGNRSTDIFAAIVNDQEENQLVAYFGGD
jgi:lipopolysaccharide export LptBFGC system permease protein LptF